MTPEISEFSYGFALTNEIVGWTSLKAAPIFPSLIEEGRAGGGYDVKLNMPGIPLYLQFKRADWMTRRSAGEISKKKLVLKIPFFRFPIMRSGISDQHALLLELDNGTNAVFYAAPRFQSAEEINHAWNAKEVAARSIFVRPGVIGPLDEQSHHISYDDHNAYLCSDPRPIDVETVAGLADILRTRLATEQKPLRETLRDFNGSLTEAWIRGRRQAGLEFGYPARRTTEMPSIGTELPSHTEPADLLRSRIPTRDAAPLSGASAELRELADKAVRYFDAQLVIVQNT